MDLACNILKLSSKAIKTGISVGKTIHTATPTERECTVDISNECLQYLLCDPSLYVMRGHCYIPLQPTIKPSSSGQAKFSNKLKASGGSVGVFTYDLYNSSTGEYGGKMAVMFKVPYELNLKANGYALGVMEMDTDCDKQLFQEMSKTTNPKFVRSNANGPSITVKSDIVTLRATMSDCTTAVMKIEVSDP